MVDGDVIAQLRRAGCVFAEDEERILVGHAAETGESLPDLVARRCAGEPLEYVVGWAQFRGLRIAVDPGVFVPRRRTEYLADVAIRRARDAAGRPVVLDLCCGAGAIAAAVHAALPAAALCAADLDPAAVACARRNLGAAAAVYCGDLFAPLPDSLRGRIDVVVANAPYVPSDGIAFLPPEAREHENRAALDGGSDGLSIARRILAAAPPWLAPGGVVLIELDEEQAHALADEARGSRLTVTSVHDPVAEQTVLVARLA